MPQFVILALVGLAAQMVDGSLGMAYGVTSSTLLVAAGITPAMASGSVHLAEVGTTLLSGASHWRFGNVDWRIVAKLGLPGAVGAYLGATALSNLATDVARPWMAAILISLGFVLLVRFSLRGVERKASAGEFRTRFLSPLGMVAGFVDATGGGGWGPIATPTLLVAGRTELPRVIGSVSASEFLVSVAASAGFLVNLSSEGVSWSIAAALLAGGALAAPFAAWLVRHVAPRVLGTGVGGLIVLTNARTVIGAIDAAPGVRVPIYLTVVGIWVAAMILAVTRHRRERSEVPEPVEV